MRQKRAKTYRKLMHLYCMSFGFRQPYQVLVDAELCLEAVSLKIDLVKQLATVLQGSVKPMITQCCIHALYLSGRDAQPAVDVAKTFERRRCNHRVETDGKMKDPVECLADVVGDKNRHRYVVAAQASAIRQRFRQIPSVPIVHVKRSVMVLEPVSEATEKAKADIEEGRLGPSKAEANAIATIASNSEKADKLEQPKKKRKGPKGPNPLSVKKKRPKAKVKGAEQQPGVGQKRKRPTDVDEEQRTHNKKLRTEKEEERRVEGEEGRRRKRRRRRKKVPDADVSKGEAGTPVADTED